MKKRRGTLRERQQRNALRRRRLEERAANRKVAKSVSQELAEFAQRAGYVVDASQHPEDIAMELLMNGVPLLAEHQVAVAAVHKRYRRRRAFYRTAQWKAARYDALKRHGGRCQCCGVSAADGARLNVDHILPMKTHWHLRLEQSNLQVLCGLCNAGKGNRDTTDWRLRA